MINQEDAILNHLHNIGPLTPLEALNLYGCFRLGARCWDLRQKGYDIQTEIVHQNGKHFASYSIKKYSDIKFQESKRGQLTFA